MGQLEDATARSRRLLREARARSRGRYHSQYYRVSWHKRRETWRTKVKVRNSEGKDIEFYKAFDDEKVAAAVADIVAMIVMPDPRRLNFDWSHGENHLPDDISVNQVYQWVVLAGMPIVRQPGKMR